MLLKLTGKIFRVVCATLCLWIAGPGITGAACWTQKSSFSGGPRMHTGAASANSMIYTGLGYESSFASLPQDWWEYDPATDLWTQQATPPITQRYYHATVAADGTIFCGLGIMSDGWTRLDDWWAYDPLADTWSAKAAFGGGKMDSPVCASAGGKVYAGLGYQLGGDVQGTAGALWEYDPSGNSWTEKAVYPGGAAQAAVGFSGSVYVKGVSADDWWQFDPGANTWTKKTDFGPVYDKKVCAAATDSRIYVISFSEDAYSGVWEYAPATDIWVYREGFANAGCYTPAAAAVSSRLYAGLGMSCNGTASVDDWWSFNTACASSTTTSLAATSSTTTSVPAAGTTTSTSSATTSSVRSSTSSSTTSIASVTAGFIGNPVAGEAPLSVQFISSAGGTAESYAWDFGDGITSSEENPQHFFTAPGTYSITLRVAGPLNSDTFTRENYITVTQSSLVPDFSADPRTGGPPLTVHFTDTSQGSITAWQWSFGDGGTSTLQNPTYIYEKNGEYTVSLSVSDGSRSVTTSRQFYITVSPGAPEAGFEASPLVGEAPLTVEFRDTSQGIITGLHWNFGDAETSTEQSPQHIYTTPGFYTVGLTVSGTSGRDTVVRQRLITVVSASSPDTYAISGTVTGVADEAPTMHLFGATHQTTTPDSSGYYRFAGLTPGIYTVLPVRGAIRFEPPALTVTLQQADQEDLDFIRKPRDITISAAASSLEEIPDDGTTAALITVKVTGDNATGIESVSIDLEELGGSDHQPMRDDGTGGDSVQADGIYSAEITAAPGTAIGLKALRITATDAAGRSAASFVSVGVITRISGVVAGVTNSIVKNGLEGQKLIIACSLHQSASGLITALDACDTLLDILMPDGSLYRSDIPVTAYESTIEIDNAAFGSWICRLKNSCTGGRQFSLSITSAGTGIITGSVVNAADGSLLDNMDLRTDGGARGVSTDGYYTLLHAAGFFTVTASGSAFLSTSRSVLVQAGGGAELDFAMMPVAGTNSTTTTAQPSVDFSAAPRLGFAPLEVSFSNQSIGEYDSFSWNFGDGNTSTEHDPVHTYTSAGSYSVSLIGQLSAGYSKSEGKLNYITVIPNPCVLSANITDSGTLSLLRAFRDRLFARGGLPRYAVAAYYEHAHEILRVFEQHPHMQARLQTMVLENMRIVESCVAGDNAVLPAVAYTAAIDLMRELMLYASPRTRTVLEPVLHDLEHGALLEKMGIYPE